MKKIILSSLAICCYIFGVAQSKTMVPKIIKNKNGIVQSVEYPDSIDTSKIPSTSVDFIKEFLNPSENEEFILDPLKGKRKDFVNEHYDQYCKGIKVDGAGYNFHFKKGKMFYAHGNYIKIENLSVTPSITDESAKNCFIAFKNIPIDSVTGYVAELLIKNISDELNPLPKLVYKIYLFANHENNNEVGYVDAHNCKVLLTEPSLFDWAATGTFATRYSGTRQAITQNYTGAFHLADSTRGAIIHTWNLNGSINIQNDRVELSDNDNNWTAAEHSATENDMGLDVHWALQQIYDRFNVVHGINSFNDNGFAITANIHYGTTNNQRDNAFWDPTLNLLVFGDGAVKFRPVASLDAVAHEFGHGITDFQIGWGSTGDPRAFHEGLSDIWGAILESRIRPNSTWQIGEQIDLSYGCLRNIQNTNDPNARDKIANTFGSTQYNSGDSYVRGGVFSHWSYLLINGGSGTNDVGSAYTVYGMGMDIVEDLIVEAVFNNFLDNTTTYAGIRTGMVNAATALCGANSLLVRQVENAWYATGVGSQSSQPSISGSNIVCLSGSTYSVNNMPTGCSLTWTYSSNLQAYYGGSNYIALKAIANGSAWIDATVNSSCGNITLPRFNLIAGYPTPTLFVSQYSGEGEPLEVLFRANPYLAGAANTYHWYVNNVLEESNFDDNEFIRYVPCKQTLNVKCKLSNVCGTSGFSSTAVVSGDCSSPKILTVNPNPASETLDVNIASAAASDTTHSTLILSPLTDTEEETELYFVTIANYMGNVVFSSTYPDPHFIIPVSQINPGNYILSVTEGVNKYQKTVVIKH